MTLQTGSSIFSYSLQTVTISLKKEGVAIHVSLLETVAPHPTD